MVEYEHKQAGSKFILYSAVVIYLIALGIFVGIPQNDTADTINVYLFSGWIISMTIALFAGTLMMSSLTVKIEDDELKIIFGGGIFRKKFKTSNIQSCKPVRNDFIDGWGIHWNFCKGWLYNVAGWESAEITMENGKRIRIGTDEPEKLCHAINTAITKNG